MNAAAEWSELARRAGVTLERLQRARQVEVGTAARRALWCSGGTTLYQYLPLRERVGPPLLICFALVNRPYILDLQPDRSLIRRLLEAGRDVHLIEWGTPQDADRHLELEDYIETHLGGCITQLLGAQARGGVDLLGVCQGGVLSLCYAALHPERVRRLITLTTAVDFHTADNLLTRWVRGLDTELLAACGNVPGEVLNALFLALMPFRLTQEKYVRLFTAEPDQRAVEDFVRMERWIFDSPPQAARALAQYVRWFYQENRLWRGTLRLAGRTVSLRAIRQPLLNLFARDDHLVPPAACAALGDCVASSDYSACEVATGHIGMYVSRAAREEIPRRIVVWLAVRRAAPGDPRAHTGSAPAGAA
ncbi:MAG: class III poly(R)-hydroxyalkanoic acid synthase subunit PhaC, partial [Gammaproteobacteria bacterium]|nr:class III poly(R)-hydroxyalkanoic acid synthase subunit PhaC [Gammaproteobacteria bacterium]